MQCPMALAMIDALSEDPLDFGSAPTSALGWTTCPEGTADLIRGPLGTMAYLYPIEGNWQQIVHGDGRIGRPFVGVLEDALVFAGNVGWLPLGNLCYDQGRTALPVALRGHSIPERVGPGWAEWKGLHEPLSPTWLKQVFQYPDIKVISAETQPRRPGGTFSRFIVTR